MKIKKGVSLKNHTTFKIGGKAKYFIEAKSKKDIISAINWAQKNKVKIFILGGGSNILFSEKEFKGLIIKNSYCEIFKKGNKVYFSSGVPMARAVNFYIKNNLKGLEWAGGLPGTIGGAVRGNAGCFGGEMKDSVIEVENLHFKKNDKIKIIKRNNKNCDFNYRWSIFKKNNEIILGAYLKSGKGDKKALEEKIKYCINYRRTHHPMEYPSAGSVFKNIPLKSVNKKVRELFKDKIKYDPFPIIPVAAIIDKAGLKGKKIGGAEISTKMPNFIINKNKASFSDIIKLVNLAKKEVKKKFNIKLEEEIKIIKN